MTSCTFPSELLDIRMETFGKGSNDFDANIVGAENVDCDQAGCTATVIANDDIQTIRIEVTADQDDDFRITSFLGDDTVCLEVNREVVIDGLTAECENVNEIRFDDRNEDTFDVIPFLANFLECPELVDTDSPTVFDAFNVDNDDDNVVAAVVGSALGVSGLLFVCAAFVYLKRDSTKEKQKQKAILVGTDQSSTRKVELAPQQASAKPLAKYQIDSLDVNARESMAKFDTQDFTRLSGLSMLTTNTNTTSRTDVSQEDFDNHERVRSVVSQDKRNFAHLSILVAKQVGRLTLNAVEVQNRDIDINERVLNKVVPFVKALLKPHQTKETDMLKFNLNSAPRVSMKFYMSRLIMGLNQWFYEDELSNEIGLRCLFLALIYLDKLPQKVKGFYVTNLNIYKLLATFMLIAAKFTEDDIITNVYWADVCGYTVEDVNEMEALLCFKFQFGFVVNPSELSNLFLLFNQKQIPSGMKAAGGVDNL